MAARMESCASDGSTSFLLETGDPGTQTHTFVDRSSDQHSHESLGYFTSADVCFGCDKPFLNQRENINY